MVINKLSLKMGITNIRNPDIDSKKYIILYKLLVMTPRTLYLIKRAEIEVTSRMSKTLEPYGITPIQFTVLYFVDYDKGDLSSAQLSRRFSMTPQSMNELVKVLETKKLLKKTVDPAHKRILRLSLTPKGKKMLQDCNSALDIMESFLLQALSATETDNLRKTIGKILDSSRMDDDANA
jgi:DNA-binding MarR family transcriptional regulator